MEVTGTAQQQAWADDVLPPVEQVRDGLWSIPVPIPNNPLRYVLVYAFALPDGVAVVDTGWDTDEAWQALVHGLAQGGWTPADVKAALITHIHPDHYGLAGRVREASGAWVGLHPADAALLPGRYGAGMDRLVEAMRALMVDCGVPDEELSALAGASMGVRHFVDQAQPDRLIEDGDRLDLPGWDLVAIWTPGHSPGHLCFAERSQRLLLSGDHVLPRISPNIAIHAQQRDNPLADFLDALAQIRSLDIDEVLPAHEYRFRGLADRVDTLLGHHHDRLDEVERLVRALGEPTCWELTTQLSWSRPWEQITGFMRRAANGETLAHLVLLEAQGRLKAVGHQPQRWATTG